MARRSIPIIAFHGGLMNNIYIYIYILGLHIYADQPRAHKVCIIGLESEHSKLTCINNLY